MTEPNRTAPAGIIVLGIFLALGQMAIMFLSMPFRLREPNVLEVFLRANSTSYRAVQLGEIPLTFLMGAGLFFGAIALIGRLRPARSVFSIASVAMALASFGSIAYRFAVVFPLIGVYNNQLPPRNPQMKNCGFGIVLRPGEWESIAGQIWNLSGLVLDLAFLGLSLVIVIVMCATTQWGNTAAASLDHAAFDRDVLDDNDLSLPW